MDFYQADYKNSAYVKIVGLMNQDHKFEYDFHGVVPNKNDIITVDGRSYRVTKKEFCLDNSGLEKVLVHVELNIL